MGGAGQLKNSLQQNIKYLQKSYLRKIYILLTFQQFIGWLIWSFQYDDNNYWGESMLTGNLLLMCQRNLLPPSSCNVIFMDYRKDWGGTLLWNTGNQLAIKMGFYTTSLLFVV
jgi:hypothetical protein